jgi:hypothetical protein
MRPKQLERKLTLGAEFNDLILGVLPLFILAPTFERIGGGMIVFLLALFILIGMTAWLAYRYYGFEQQLDKHESTLEDLANTHSWELQTYQTEEPLPSEIENISLLLIADRDRRLVNYLLTPDWNYIDFSYCVYRQTKHGEYRSAFVYYSVLVTKLPRILPNVFFDSKSQGGRQYKAKFDKDQRHSLEGDFDTYFDTYFAEGYTIDSMSFITPDVMQALEDAHDYDIEIIGDRLLMYGPVYVDASKVTNGAAKLQAILNTLQVTARAYEDERLPGSAGRQTVTPTGLQLRRKTNIVRVTLYFVCGCIILRFLSLIHVLR